MKFAYDSTDKTIKFKGLGGMTNAMNKAKHNEKEQQNVR